MDKEEKTKLAEAPLSTVIENLLLPITAFFFFNFVWPLVHKQLTILLINLA